MAKKADVLLPDIGDFKDVEIIEILVKPGDRVAPEDPLITLESDKASMEIPSPQAGVVSEIRIKVGDKVNEGDLILVLDTDAGDEAPAEVNAVEAAEHLEDAPASASQGDAPPPAEPAPSAAAAPAATVAEVRDVHLPDIGDFKDVEVIEILVAVGDTVEAEQSLLTLESDKASMEIPAPFAGTVESLAVKVGDRISEGTLIGRMQTTAAAGTA
ncbi:MAG: biotin/lipoyl-binding protein, partial [Gammaproteobacteria bacterium]|nr:biotin/lipoyl-binding protein [Gammaproteobacteria bacterium]